MPAGPVLVLGTGDVGSAVAHALHQAGRPVALHDDPAPPHPRRGMAFVDALWDGTAVLAGITAHRATDAAELRGLLRTGGSIPVTTLSLDATLALLPWHALVDARMRKRAVPDNRRGAAALVVGLGPGFAAGGNCDVAVETSWENLGAVVRDGPTLPLRGEPRPIAGIGRERAIYAPADGVFCTARRISEPVAAGEVVADVEGLALRVAIAGVLRGLVRDGSRVRKGGKVVEVDPRGTPDGCFGIGERPRRLAASVLALLSGPVYNPEQLA